MSDMTLELAQQRLSEWQSFNVADSFDPQYMAARKRAAIRQFKKFIRENS